MSHAYFFVHLASKLSSKAVTMHTSAMCCTPAGLWAARPTIDVVGKRFRKCMYSGGKCECFQPPLATQSASFWTSAQTYGPGQLEQNASDTLRGVCSSCPALPNFQMWVDNRKLQTDATCDCMWSAILLHQMAARHYGLEFHKANAGRPWFCDGTCAACAAGFFAPVRMAAAS